MEIDWGDGDYGRTAEALTPAAEAVVGAVDIAPGEWVLDIGCGTGNAALAAAGRGASVVGVDLSASLVDTARARARLAQVPDATFVVGDAGNLPVEAGAFDVALSVFGVIFAPDPAEAVDQMLRAVRPGGRVVLATWLAHGPVHAAVRALLAALPSTRGDAGVRWEDAGWVRDLLASAGAREIAQREHALPIEAESSEAWFAEQEEHHPVWRWARRLVPPEGWEALRADTVATLDAGSKDGGRLRVLSPYVVTRAVR